jgi:PBP1b-binding outer membrane lipoprotein LpoB
MRTISIKIVHVGRISMKKVSLFCLAIVMLLSGCSSSKDATKTIKNTSENKTQQFIMGGK